MIQKVRLTGWRRYPVRYEGHGESVKSHTVFLMCFSRHLTPKTGGDSRKRGKITQRMSKKGKQQREKAKLPVATVAYYGPDNKTATLVFRQKSPSLSRYMG
jgi:hypothetical protein